MSAIGEDPNEPYGNYTLPEWFNGYFDERQRKQIMWSMLYDQKLFRHGTDGHNAMIIIAKLAELAISQYGIRESLSRSYMEEKTKNNIATDAMLQAGRMEYQMTDDGAAEMYWIKPNGVGLLLARIPNANESDYLASVFESMHVWEKAFRILTPEVK